MNGEPFHDTKYGRKFFRSDFPRLLETLDRIAKALESLVKAEEERSQSKLDQGSTGFR